MVHRGIASTASAYLEGSAQAVQGWTLARSTQTHSPSKGVCLVMGIEINPRSRSASTVDPVKLARACERDYNLLSISMNNVALIEHDVPIAQFQRIEAYGDGSDLTPWCHPKTPTIEWFECAGENCGISLPSGTRMAPTMLAPRESAGHGGLHSLLQQDRRCTTYPRSVRADEAACPEIPKKKGS